MIKNFGVPLTILLAAFAMLALLWLLDGCAAGPTVRVSPLTFELPTATPDANLLANPSFEGEYTCQENKCTAPGWTAWWMELPKCRPLTSGCSLPCPSNCIKESASQLFGTDGYISVPTTTLTVGTPELVTITLFVTSQLQAADVLVFVNPAVMTVTAESLDEYATVHWARGVVRYGRETPTATVGTIPLMRLEITPAVTESVTFEIVYWLWNPAGGQYQTAWERYNSTPRRLSVQTAAGAPKCVADTGCYWAVPEFKPTDRPERVHSGQRSQQWFTFGRMHEGGVTQTVSVTPGQWYRFSVWMQGWQCYDWMACCDKRPSCISDQPAELNLQVGIAVTDTVAWGAAGESFDSWARFDAVAQAVTDTLTVVVRSRARFDWARENNDVYLDDARLEAVQMLWLPMVEVGSE